MNNQFQSISPGIVKLRLQFTTHVKDIVSTIKSPLTPKIMTQIFRPTAIRLIQISQAMTHITILFKLSPFHLACIYLWSKYFLVRPKASYQFMTNHPTNLQRTVTSLALFLSSCLFCSQLPLNLSWPLMQPKTLCHPCPPKIVKH